MLPGGDPDAKVWEAASSIRCVAKPGRSRASTSAPTGNGSPRAPGTTASARRGAARSTSEGILAAIELGVSNGRLEGINNKIGVIKHRAYGFHSAAALIAMVFLCCSAIEITLPI